MCHTKLFVALCAGAVHSYSACGMHVTEALYHALVVLHKQTSPTWCTHQTSVAHILYIACVVPCTGLVHKHSVRSLGANTLHAFTLTSQNRFSSWFFTRCTPSACVAQRLGVVQSSTLCMLHPHCASSARIARCWQRVLRRYLTQAHT